MGNDGGGQSEIEQRVATTQLLGNLFDPPRPNNALIARVAHDLSQYHNMVVMHPPDPIVKPRVRLFSQWAPAPQWGPWYVRAPGQRNSFNEQADKTAGDNPVVPQTALNGNDNWKDNGCFPTCVAMIVRWWAEDNPETKGKLKFPFPGRKNELDPVEMCRRLFGKPYAPCVQIQVAAEDQDKRKASGFNDPTHEWVMNQDAILRGFRSIVRPDFFVGFVPPAPENQTTPPQTYYMQHERLSTSLSFPGTLFPVPMTLEQRRTMLKWALQFGPAVVALQYPGHFVVVDGHRGHEISICDPGNIMVNPGDWATAPTKRQGDLPPGENPSGGYVQVDDQVNFKTANGKFDNPWLMQITSIDRFYHSKFDDHPEWSNLQETH